MEKRVPGKDYGLFIDYEFCTGCHSCEMACKVEHGFPKGQYGIKVQTYGPMQREDGTWDFHYVPVPTSLCDLCYDRVEEGRWPTCVHHCQASVMEYGSIEELAKRMSKPYTALFRPDYDKTGYTDK